MTRSARVLLTCFAVLLALPVAEGQRLPGHPRRNRPGLSGFELIGCSLGCRPGPNGAFSCADHDIHLNQEIRLTFSEPVALASLNVLSFQIVDLTTASVPPASFSLAPREPNTLVFRPQMAFDSAGNPLFSFVLGHTYRLFLPGQIQGDPGPFITSINGQPNRIRLDCTLNVTLGLEDASPGRPTAQILVQVVTARDPVTGQATAFATVPAAGAQDVWRASPIEFRFDDVMNPASLLNPVTGVSNTIRVRFDPDGNVADASDQVPIPGSFTLSFTDAPPSTLVRFVAQGGLPAAGLVPGRVVVELAPSISDLVSNPLTNPGRTAFTTEVH